MYPGTLELNQRKENNLWFRLMTTNFFAQTMCLKIPAKPQKLDLTSRIFLQEDQKNNMAKSVYLVQQLLEEKLK